MPTTEQRIAGIRRELCDDLTGLSDVCHVTTFKAYRGNDRITVEIEDYGDDSAPRQYRCYARAEDGRYATGNPAESPAMAIATAHWWDLDK